MENNLNNYDYIEATEFEGIMPQVIEKIGAAGKSDMSVGTFEHTVLGAMPMETPDFAGLLENTEEGGEGGN